MTRTMLALTLALITCVGISARARGAEKGMDLVQKFDRERPQYEALVAMMKRDGIYYISKSLALPKRAVVNPERIAEYGKVLTALGLHDFGGESGGIYFATLWDARAGDDGVAVGFAYGKVDKAFIVQSLSAPSEINFPVYKPLANDWYIFVQRYSNTPDAWHRAPQ